MCVRDLEVVSLGLNQRHCDDIEAHWTRLEVQKPVEQSLDPVKPTRHKSVIVDGAESVVVLR